MMVRSGCVSLLLAPMYRVVLACAHGLPLTGNLLHRSSLMSADEALEREASVDLDAQNIKLERENRAMESRLAQLQLRRSFLT